MLFMVLIMDIVCHEIHHLSNYLTKNRIRDKVKIKGSKWDKNDVHDVMVLITDIYMSCHETSPISSLPPTECTNEIAVSLAFMFSYRGFCEYAWANIHTNHSPLPPEWEEE